MKPLLKTSMPRNLIIIQARLSSSRLPGKVLKPIHGSLSLLDIQVQVLKKIGIPFVVATSTNSADDPLQSWAEEHEVHCFRGEENNVLNRFIDCALSFEAENIIRVCSDNPFLQFEEISKYLEVLNKGTDYISYCSEAGTPAIRTHWGLFVEGVTLSALKKAQSLLIHHPQREFYSEHVTNFIYENPNDFNVLLEKAPLEVFNRNDLRFTIDTIDDFNNMQNLLGLVGLQASLRELIIAADGDPAMKESMLTGIRHFNK